MTLYILLFTGMGTMAPAFLGAYETLSVCEAAKATVAREYLSGFADKEKIFQGRLVCVPSKRP